MRDLTIRLKRNANNLAVLVLQSRLYEEDHDIREEVDNVIALCNSLEIEMLEGKEEEVQKQIVMQQKHPFRGSSDRWCEICNRPDRDEIHNIEPTKKIYMKDDVEIHAKLLEMAEWFDDPITTPDIIIPMGKHGTTPGFLLRRIAEALKQVMELGQPNV